MLLLLRWRRRLQLLMAVRQRRIRRAAMHADVWVQRQGPSRPSPSKLKLMLVPPRGRRGVRLQGWSAWPVRRRRRHV
jgi:hypothetical protein